jgi:hypothetical protein
MAQLANGNEMVTPTKQDAALAKKVGEKLVSLRQPCKTCPPDALPGRRPVGRSDGERFRRAW